MRRDVLLSSILILAATLVASAAPLGSQAEPIRPGGPGTIPEEIQKERIPTRSTDEIRQAQEALKEKGLYRGAIDGVMDHDTRNALMVFQRSQGLSATGTLDDQTRKALNLRFERELQPEQPPPAHDWKIPQEQDVRPIG